MKPAAFVSICFLALVALGHLLRVGFGITVTVGTFAVPMWASVLAVVGPGALAIWLWREQRR